MNRLEFIKKSTVALAALTVLPTLVTEAKPVETGFDLSKYKLLEKEKYERYVELINKCTMLHITPKHIMYDIWINDREGVIHTIPFQTDIKLREFFEKLPRVDGLVLSNFIKYSLRDAVVTKNAEITIEADEYNYAVRKIHYPDKITNDIQHKGGEAMWWDSSYIMTFAPKPEIITTSFTL